MSATEQIIKSGSNWCTTYEPSSEGLSRLIDDFYANQMESFGKAAGAVGYGLSSPNGEGYFNAIIGKKITVGVYSCDNIFTVMGSRAYDHEGVRIQYKMPSYGMAEEFKHNGVSMVGSQTGFLGIGAGTNQDGLIPDSVYIPIDDFREPYKEVPYAYDYGLGLQALENKDDTIVYKDYVDKISTAYSDNVDRAILRPLYQRQPTASNNNIVSRTAETSLQGISRAIASGTEIGKTYNGVTIDESMVSPYGGVNGDFYNYRGYNNDAHDAHNINAIDGNVIDLDGRTVTRQDFRKAYRTASSYWQGGANPNGKLWAMSNIMQDKLAALEEANHTMLNTVYAVKSIGGVKTIPGRDYGLVLNSFNNIPIIQDCNLNFDYTTDRISTVKMGDTYLLDLEHIWMSMLTPVQTWINNNVAVNRALLEKTVINSRMELRTDKYITHCKIVNPMDDE